MRTYQLYASISASANNAAEITVARSGRIRGIAFAVRGGGASDGDICDLEVSFTPASQVASNDAQGVLATRRFSIDVLTSGTIMFNENSYVGPLDIEVQTGQKIYLNAVESGTATWLANILIYIS